ncbi:interleukin-34 isoform 1-T1 [Anomaloglossus baeobatrachus]|uniref:interleukin-34 isoform X1 n=1 Tax=Anomaloglossus baeobatrachus TaxID=238106 RepID=UPI003F4FEEA5
MAVQRGVVFFLWVLVLGRTAVIQDKCRIVELLSRKLQYENRILYMHEYFPTDYQLPVKHEEILRCQNITSLVSKGVSVDELRFLWGIVSENVLLSIWRVLPQRHPSRTYVNDLKTIFHVLHVGDRLDLSDRVKDIVGRLWTPGGAVIGVSPRDLLDDCLRVLDVLYQEACALCLPSSALQDALCPLGTVPGPDTAHRPSC